jgi:hypothetical protein
MGVDGRRGQRDGLEVGRCQSRFDRSRPSQFRFLPNARQAFGRSLVLIGAEVDSAAFGAGFAVDIGVDVGFQVTGDSRR